MQTYIVIVSGSTAKHFHCSFVWHLTPQMTLANETCIRRTPCIKRTLQLSIPRGCPINTGFIVPDKCPGGGRRCMLGID